MNYIHFRTLECATYMLQNKTTIRKTANKFNLSKSTLHSDIHKYLPNIDIKLYKKICALLNQNNLEKHIRGGLKTKEKYEKFKQKKWVYHFFIFPLCYLAHSFLFRKRFSLLNELL